MEFRIERDTLGEVKVPRDALYGAQTQRAVENFPISGQRLPHSFIRAQAIIKIAAARANMAADRLDEEVGNALIAAGEEILEEKHADQFVVDVFQAGAGTSQNMNINEVLANRATELLGGERGDYSRIHPNDHANMAQSTNDTIHVAIHISAYCDIHARLLPAIRALAGRLREKAGEFDGIVKSGRTHLQDAVPMRLGQEFGAWATMMERGAARVEHAADGLLEICIGGTAIGTGLNTDPNYVERAVAAIAELTGHPFRAAEDLFEAIQGMDAVVEIAGALRVLTTGLRKIADDLRLLSSGPRTGLAELRLPPVQPGSSIMPGKVNPVMAEMMNMICFHAMGCDTAIVAAAQAGQLELNVMMPMIAYDLLMEIEILARGMAAFGERCVAGIVVNEEACRLYAERSPSVGTALAPEIGYERAAKLAYEALEKDALIRDLALEQGILDEAQLTQLLDLIRLTKRPGE